MYEDRGSEYMMLRTCRHTRHGGGFSKSLWIKQLRLRSRKTAPMSVSPAASTERACERIASLFVFLTHKV